MIALYILLALLSNQSYVSEQPESDKIKYLALGDSYTIGESVEEHERWPNLLARMLEEELDGTIEVTIIAKTGWTTDELMDAVSAAGLMREYDMVSLLIGVNNQYRGYRRKQYRKEFEQLLNHAIRLAEGDKNRVFVLSIPDYGVTPFAQDKNPEQIASEIDQYNNIAEEICGKYEVIYLDITDMSRKAASDGSLIANDGLHPSGKMYEMWAKMAFSSSLSLFK